MRISIPRTAAAGLAAALCLALRPAAAGAQSPAPPSGHHARSGRDFPAERFDAVSRTAAYLAVYDRVAWVTTDSVMALAQRDTAVRSALGAEWFAFEQDATWHAVYGRYDAVADRYEQAAHYAARQGEPFRLQAAPVDSLLARRYGRAIALTSGRLPDAARKSGARFNVYVRPAASGGLELWYLPAWQRNGWLIHGMEFEFQVDSSGRRIADSTFFVTRLRGGPPDTSQVLDIFADDRELPTVGQAFFALYYGRYFKAVYIRNRDFVTSFFDQGGHRAWMHALRQDREGAVPGDSAR